MAALGGKCVRVRILPTAAVPGIVWAEKKQKVSVCLAAPIAYSSITLLHRHQNPQSQQSLTYFNLITPKH